ncbi:MAG: type VI secretion system contractile sheath small subunit [Mariniblastus sp.]|nr:type VI secretion system contractile sheath small subunit [Mariniblastus sp.]
MSESQQDRIERFRKPRVHIKYEVHTGGAQLKVDLPFVIGVMGDFSGDPRGELKSLDDRKFTSIDRNNFDEVLRKLKPGLDLRVENTLEGGDSELGVQLNFESMDDFDPTNVAKQIPALKSLLDTRSKLRDLITKIDRSPELENLLTQVLKNQDDLNKLSSELGDGGSTEAASGEESAE